VLQCIHEVTLVFFFVYIFSLHRNIVAWQDTKVNCILFDFVENPSTDFPKISTQSVQQNGYDFKEEQNMRNLEMQVDTLMRLCAAETPAQKERLRRELLVLLNQSRINRLDPEYLTRQILLDIGAPDHLLGHPFAVEAVVLCVNDGCYINNITFGLYPQIAAKFDTTASRVERGIRHLIEVTWTRADMDILCGYFGNTVSPDRGKPTNGEFIARIANVVRQRMREAA
jgi:hypothetical protein